MVAGTEGSLTVAEPLSKVSASMKNGRLSIRPATSIADTAMTERPATITSATYASPDEEERVACHALG